MKELIERLEAAKYGIEQAIAIARQVSAEQTEDRARFVELPKGLLNLMGDAPTRKDGDSGSPAVATSPAQNAEQPSEIPVVAGFVIDLANTMEAALKNSDGNYCEASMEVFNFIYPYLRTTEPVSVSLEKSAKALEAAIEPLNFTSFKTTIQEVYDAVGIPYVD